MRFYNRDLVKYFHWRVGILEKGLVVFPNGYSLPARVMRGSFCDSRLKNMVGFPTKALGIQKFVEIASSVFLLIQGSRSLYCRKYISVAVSGTLVSTDLRLVICSVQCNCDVNYTELGQTTQVKGMDPHKTVFT